MNFLAFLDADLDHNFALMVILIFAALVVLVKTIGKVKRQKLWHETARLALEKGLPVPSAMPDRDDFRNLRRWDRGQRRCGGGWTRGLIWIAAAAGLYLVDDGASRRWAILPACVGAAILVGGLIESAQSKDDNQLPPSA